MTVFPVMVRELRAEARRSFNYLLRVLGVAAALVVFVAVMVDQRGSPAEIGVRLFRSLNAVLFVAIWLLVPLLTADCISREKREGTLGLLFLTPLTAGGIVSGKSLIHGLRSLTFFLAMLPILMLPFLLGGVSWRDVVLALSFNSCAILLALAAGLLASSWTRDWVRALILAETMSLIFLGLFLSIHYLGFVLLDSSCGLVYRNLTLYGPGSAGHKAWQYAWYQFWSQSFFPRFTHALTLATGLPLYRYGRYEDAWSAVWTRQTPQFQDAWLEFAGGLLVLSTVALLLAIWLAAWRVNHAWREEPPSRRELWLLKTFCTPRFWQAVFRSKMGRTMERNPIGWLQQYSWSARLAKWGWCLLIIIVECLLIADPTLGSLLPGQYWLAGLMSLSLGFSSAASFRQERETGAMELLLVTPLRVGQIIGGRVRGIWRQFLPSLLMLLLVWGYMRQQLALWYSHSGSIVSESFPCLLASSFLALPVIGLYFSLRRWNIIVAWLLTCFCGLVLPALLGALTIPVTLRPCLFFWIIGWQTLCAGLAWLLLHRDLTHRRFVLV